MKQTFEQWLEGFGNQGHPERKSDEVYMGNSTKEDFKTIGYTTKRMGAFAKRTDGVPMDKYSQAALFPVFVKRDELEQYFYVRVM